MSGLSDGVMVTQSPLKALFMVRIHVGQPSFLQFRSADSTRILFILHVVLLSDPGRTFQPNHEDADVGRRDSGNSRGLTNGFRADLYEFLPGFEPQTGHG